MGRFKQEARRHLQALSDQLAVLDRVYQPGLVGTTDELLSEAEFKSLRELFRLAHTLKGSAKMVGQVEVADLAEQLETFLGEAYLNKQHLSIEQHSLVPVLVKQIQPYLN